MSRHAYPMLFAVVLATLPMFGLAAADNGAVRSNDPLPDFSGSYVTGSPAGRCAPGRLDGGERSTHTLVISQSGSMLTLRMLPTAAVRVLHVRTRAAHDSAPSRNGLARWTGRELVVESDTPAFPLWAEVPLEEPGVLIERLALTADGHLTYSASAPHSPAFAPVEVRLTRCAVSHRH